MLSSVWSGSLGYMVGMGRWVVLVGMIGLDVMCVKVNLFNSIQLISAPISAHCAVDYTLSVLEFTLSVITMLVPF